jgi:hypothetical protein
MPSENERHIAATRQSDSPGTTGDVRLPLRRRGIPRDQRQRHGRAGQGTSAASCTRASPSLPAQWKPSSPPAHAFGRSTPPSAEKECRVPARSVDLLAGDRGQAAGRTRRALPAAGGDRLALRRGTHVRGDGPATRLVAHYDTLHSRWPSPVGVRAPRIVRTRRPAQGPEPTKVGAMVVPEILMR